MKPDPKAARTTRLPLDERAELQRQGAKAAARGDNASSNPMHEPPNTPAATGESKDIWHQRQEAWQQGHDAQSGTPDTVPTGPGSQETDEGRE